jgi:hypothetical protein
MYRLIDQAYISVKSKKLKISKVLIRLLDFYIDKEQYDFIQMSLIKNIFQMKIK